MLRPKKFDTILIMDIQHIYHLLKQACPFELTEAALLYLLADSIKRCFGAKVGNYSELLDRVMIEDALETVMGTDWDNINCDTQLLANLDTEVFARFRIVQINYLYHIKKIRYIRGALWVII